MDSYIGRALVKELRKADGGLNRIFGTASGEAPAAVKRVVCRDDPKKVRKSYRSQGLDARQRGWRRPCSPADS